jgi:hypothetical protein
MSTTRTKPHAVEEQVSPASPASAPEPVLVVERDGVTYLDPDMARRMTQASAQRWKGLLDRLAK